MSTESDTPGKKVLDEEGTVDQKVKDRILKARQRVDDREDYLYIEAPVDNDKSVDELEKVVYWGMVVKQYIRSIKPLLTSEDVNQSYEYAVEEPIGTIMFYPRDTDGIPFSQLRHGDINTFRFKKQHNLPADVTLPTPAERAIVGLTDVLRLDTTVSHTWTVQAGQFNHPDAGGVIRITDEKPVPKHLYEKAVELADEFLQQAGVGLNVGAREVTSKPDPI